MSTAEPAQRSRVLAACATFAGAELSHPFGDGTAVFKVGGKIFALVSLGDGSGSLSVKCEPEFGERRRAESPAIIPGYHLNKRHWITIALDAGVPFTDVEEILEDSHDLVVESLPKRQRALLLAGGD